MWSRVGSNGSLKGLHRRRTRTFAKRTPKERTPLKTRYSPEGEAGVEVGVDDVARGPLFGRVYAGAVVLPPGVDLHPWLDDSKKVTPKRRAEVRKWVEREAVAWGVGYVEPGDIDRLNIRNAAFVAMNVAIGQVLAAAPRAALAVIDGNGFTPTTALPYVCVVQADALYAHVAAASILAKEHHDDYIRALVAAEPDLETKYGLLSNVGYGSKRHLEGLRQHGPHHLHRYSFSVVALAKERTEWATQEEEL